MSPVQVLVEMDRDVIHTVARVFIQAFATIAAGVIAFVEVLSAVLERVEDTVTDIFTTLGHDAEVPSAM
jgi:hypothetical protein